MKTDKELTYNNEYGEGYETLKPTIDYFENMRKDEKGE